jgi:hypothetical protein
MKTLFTNFQMFVTIGILVIMYIYLMNWSVTNFISFKSTHSLKKKGYTKDKYLWQEIVSIPVYILTWAPFLMIIIAFIGGFVYLLFDVFMSMINML